MSDNQANPNTILITKPVQMIWGHVVTPRPSGKFKAEPRYEATFLFPIDHPDLPEIEKIIFRLAKEKFGRHVAYPLKRGAKLADAARAKGRDREFLRPFMLCAAHANTSKRDGTPLSPPRLVVLQNGQYIRYTTDDERRAAAKFFDGYPGVLVRPTLSFTVFEGFGGGVSAYLNEILSLNAGERLNIQNDEAKYGEVESMSQYLGHVSTIDPRGSEAEAEAEVF